MESRYRYEKISLALLFCCLLFAGCTKEVKQPAETLPLNEIQNGDIICRLGNGFFSNQFKKYSQTEKIYSHVGIIEKRNDSLFVIHAEASELTGIGYVKREPIEVFLSNIKIWGVYRVNASDSVRNNITKHAKEYFTRNTPFDMDFDATDDSKVYCTELVANSINKAFGDSIIKPAMYLGKLKVYGIDNVYLLPDIQVIKKIGS